MSDQAHRAVAVVGVGAILPDAPDVSSPEERRMLEMLGYLEPEESGGADD